MLLIWSHFSGTQFLLPKPCAWRESRKPTCGSAFFVGSVLDDAHLNGSVVMTVCRRTRSKTSLVRSNVMPAKPDLSAQSRTQCCPPSVQIDAPGTGERHLAFLNGLLKHLTGSIRSEAQAVFDQGRRRREPRVRRRNDRSWRHVADVHHRTHSPSLEHRCSGPVRCLLRLLRMHPAVEATTDRSPLAPPIPALTLRSPLALGARALLRLRCSRLPSVPPRPSQHAPCHRVPALRHPA